MDIREKKIIFQFNDSWTGLMKYDKSTDYKKIVKSKDTKAVDIIGVHNNDLIFIEIKDYRGSRIRDKEKLTNGEIEKIFATKVKDTVAGIVGGARNSTNDQILFKDYLSRLTDNNNLVKVVLWMEEDQRNITPTGLKKLKIRNSTHVKRLKIKLKWLTNRIFVANHRENPFADTLNIQFLPD